MLQWQCLNRHKLFYDEAWIINHEDIHPGEFLKFNSISSQTSLIFIFIIIDTGVRGKAISSGALSALHDIL